MINALAKQSDGFVRLAQIIAPGGPIPIGRSTWFEWVKAGRAPAPTKLGPRVSGYRISEIDAFLADPKMWAAVHCNEPAGDNVGTAILANNHEVGR